MCTDSSNNNCLEISFFKVTSLPLTGKPDSIYLLLNGSSVQQYVTDKMGNFLSAPGVTETLTVLSKSGNSLKYKDESGLEKIIDFSQVAFTGDYNDLINTISNTSDLINDGDGISPFVTVADIPTNLSDLVLDVGIGSDIEFDTTFKYILKLVDQDTNVLGSVEITTANIKELGNYTGLDVRYYTKSQINNFFSGSSPISGYNKSNWDTAFGWGNHADAGYLTSISEEDPFFTASPAFNITNPNIANWNTAFGWGNHADAGYLTSFTETDPVFIASDAASVTASLIGEWNSAYDLRVTNLGFNTGNGNLTITRPGTTNLVSSIDGRYSLLGHTHTTAQVVGLDSTLALKLDTATYLTSIAEYFDGTTPITGYNRTDWDTAFAWGNHASAGYELLANKGVANGYAELDGSGLVPTSQLPGFVDDVVEYDDLASFPVTGESGKIYVAKDTNIIYRWSGSAYVIISSTLALGETSATAYRGDRGKIAYDHTFLTDNPHSVTKTHVGLGNVDNTSDLNKPISTLTQTALDGKENIFSKNTGFNKNFGTTAGTVSEGNHTHTFASLTSKPTTIGGYGITDAYTKTESDNRYYTETESDGKFLLNTTDTLTGNFTATGNINANKGIFGGNSNPVDLVGSGIGNANISIARFFESNGTTRQGYLGFASGSSSDLFLYNDVGTNYLRVMGGGGVDGLFYNWSGGSGKVWHAGNDGSGSGLDADLLDGKQAIDFVHYEYPLNGSGVFVSSVSGRIGHISNSGTDLGGSLPDSFGSLFTFQGSTNSRGFTFYHPNSSNSVLFAGLATGDGSVTYRRIGFMDTTNTGDFSLDGHIQLNDFRSLKLGTTSPNVNLYSSGTNIEMDLIDVDFRIRNSGVGTLFTFGRTTGDFTASGEITTNGNELNISGASPRTRYLEDGGTTGDWTTVVDSGNFYIRNNYVSNTRMLIFASGVVEFFNNVSTTGTMTATNFILSSDERLKDFIEDIDYEEIDVSWKTFELKSDKGQKRYGVIAQELEKKHPEFVRTDKEGMKSVAYIDLLIAKNNELENRVKILEDKLELLVNTLL